MGKIDYGKRKRLRRGWVSVKADANRLDLAAKWLRKNKTRIRQERAREGVDRFLDAQIPWERFEAF